MSVPTTNTAFTSPINPPNASPILTLPQIWAMLALKIKSAETFVPGGISSTTVLSEFVSTRGNPVTVREVVFVADNRKATETVTVFGDNEVAARNGGSNLGQTRVEFVQEDGSKVMNIVSEGEGGELYMTYVFEWRHPGASEEELRGHGERMRNMSGVAVKGTIEKMRELVRSGRF